MGLLDLIVYNPGTNFIAKEFKQNVHTLYIRTKAVLTEAAQSIGIIEHYHTPIHRIYEVIAGELNLPASTANKSLIL